MKLRNVPGIKHARSLVKAALVQDPKYIRYSIGCHALSLPFDHHLPKFQARHRLYDRFLPVLCAQLPKSGLIVDVGANVGDTVAAILQTCANPIIAIEGHLPYFEILKANLAKIDEKHRVTAVYALAGTTKKIGPLAANIGSSAFDPNNELRMQAIDEILVASLRDVALLKVDTDGYDDDVILSGMGMIEASQPLLFWEGGTTGATAFEGMYKNIEAFGYEQFWVFDNFGNLILEECRVKELKSLDRYIASLHNHKCSVGINYIDVLASTPKTLGQARAAILEYRCKFIEIFE